MEAEPLVEVSFSEFVKTLDQSFQNKKRFSVKELEKNVSIQVESYRSDFRRYLDENWLVLFPGETKDLVTIEKALDNFLMNKSKEIFNKIKTQLLVEKAYRVVFGFIYERQFLNLLMAGVGALFLTPLSMFMIFVQSNLAMYAGFAGVVVFPIISAVKLTKYLTWRKEKSK